ncbi:hypothetical protein ACFL2Y_02865 [Candidatus Omnitrophota bacterium]
MVEHCAFLFIGGDEQAKKNKVNAIKSQYLDKDLRDIDFEVVYSSDKGLSPPKLDEILSYLPSNKSKKRILLIKNIESLKENNRDILIKHLKSPSKSVIFLLDSAKLNAENPFIRKLGPFVKTINFKSSRKMGVFDLTQAVVERKTTSALRILSKLLENREKPQSILGALFWQWDKSKDSTSLDKFRLGLKLLLDADIRIKTGRLDEELALEMVVIRLSYLA